MEVNTFAVPSFDLLDDAKVQMEKMQQIDLKNFKRILEKKHKRFYSFCDRGPNISLVNH